MRAQVARAALKLCSGGLVGRDGAARVAVREPVLRQTLQPKQAQGQVAQCADLGVEAFFAIGSGQGQDVGLQPQRRYAGFFGQGAGAHQGRFRATVVAGVALQARFHQGGNGALLERAFQQGGADGLEQ